MTWLRGALLAVMLIAGFGAALGAQLPGAETQGSLAVFDAETPDVSSQLHQLRHAVVRLPIAAGLACLLALRPRRRGTPNRQAPVIQTQIILAIVGAVVMLVVGSSLARAFGIVGAAGLVRYRAKIDDPKDAGVMLVLWIVESFEPKATQSFELKIKAKDPAALKPLLDKLLMRYHFDFELRATSTEELEYEIKLPLEGKTDKISANIVKLAPENVTAVEWDQKKEKK